MNTGKLKSAKCTRRLFKVWINWPNSKLKGDICISVFLHTVLHWFHWEHRQVEGVRSAHGGFQIWYVINLGHPWKLIILYPTVDSFYFWYSSCIVLFVLRPRTSWRSAKCTRRLFKVWSNWPNSKLICYSERGEPRLSFESKFVGHFWKLLKLYLTIHAYLFFFTLYCIGSTENTGKLKECEVHTEAL